MVVTRATPRGQRIIVQANEALAAMLGESVEALVGRDFADFTDPQDEAADRGVTAEPAAGRQRELGRRTRYRRRDGSTVWVDVRSAVVESATTDLDAPKG